MKKLLVCLLALLLVCATALAEIRTEIIPLERGVSLNSKTDRYYMRADGGYRVFAPDGTVLSEAYSNLSSLSGGYYYVYQADGLNALGLLDQDGQLLCGPTYGKVNVLSNNWVMGYVLEPSSTDVGEFKDSNNNQYIVGRTDVLYQGRVIGSLSRNEYTPSWNASVKGDYLCLKKTSDEGTYIDRDFNQIHLETDFSVWEFESVYRKGVFHHPSQQWAYCEGCTLTPEDVSKPVYYDSTNHCLLDLQGNVVKDQLFYDQITVRNSDYGGEPYLETRLSSLYGIMDMQGNEIVPPIYDNIADLSGMFISGYQPALTQEGYLHFLNPQGEVTAKAEYALSSSDYKGFSNGAGFVHVNNMGQYIVITATHGELPTRYEDVLSAKPAHKLLRVKKNGLWGVIDMAGNTVIPFSYQSTPEINADGSLLSFVDDKWNRYLVRVTYTDDAPVIESVTVEPGNDTATPAPVEGAWSCTACGTQNTGKFCAECGTAKPIPTPTPAPVQDGSWTCTCGTTSSGKFCPECGSPRPVKPVEPQCVKCGYKPEGTTPKFCPECGNKF